MILKNSHGNFIFKIKPTVTRADIACQLHGLKARMPEGFFILSGGRKALGVTVFPIHEQTGLRIRCQQQSGFVIQHILSVPYRCFSTGVIPSGNRDRDHAAYFEGTF